MNKEFVDRFEDYILSRTPRSETIYDWARRNIYLQPPYTEHGYFNVDTSRYMIEPFKAIQSYDTNIVSIYKATQTGGSLIGDIASLWWLTHKKTPVMYATARKPLAESHMETRLKRLIYRCQDIQPLLPTDPRKITNTGIADLNYWVLGASVGNLQGRPVSMLIADETWMWEVPVDWAISRTDAYRKVGNHKVVIISQPGQVGDQTDDIFNKGTKEEWSVPCMGCGEFMQLDFHQLKWDKAMIGNEYDYAKINETIRYECPFCGYHHKDTPKLKNDWNVQGKYIQTNINPEPGNRSFHWSCLHRWKWNVLVHEWLKVNESKERGDNIPLITFIQQKLARPETGVGGVEQQEFLTVASGSFTDEALRMAAIDLQGQEDEHYYYLQIRAFSKDGRSNQLYFSKVQTVDDLLAILLQYNVNPKLTFIDIAYKPDHVAELIVKHGWCGLRGYDTDGFARTKNGAVTYKYFSRLRYHSIVIKNKVYKAQWMLWATTPIRDVVDRLRRDKTGRFLSLDNEEYKKQLFAEARDKQLDRKTNKWKIVWYKRRGSNQNHGFDTTCMLIAGAYITQQVGMVEDQSYKPQNPSSDDVEIK